MAARAIWKGVLALGSTEVPVKLYSAVEPRKVSFRLLHERDREPLKQRMVDPETEEAVEYKEARRGYPTEDGRVVILDADELDELEPEPSRQIEMTRFVPQSAVDPHWYDRPYWLGPDGSTEDYFALAAALEDSDRVGIAKWVMRKKEYVGALRAEDGYLMLVTMRHAGEVVSADALQPPGGRKLDSRELKMAEQLVEALTGEFEPEQYRDEYAARVMELVEAKAKGKKLPKKRARRKAADDESLADALEKSLKAARAA
ncbi:MAG: non-homologous end joining protein Ku [Longimicrobiales bacterium]